MSRAPALAAVGLAILAATPASAWDSARFELLATVIHPTHSFFTEFAIDQLKAEFPELETYRDILIEGANAELHELPVEGNAHGLDLEAKRVEHRGTNAGSDDVAGWWADAEAAAAAGNLEQAWFITGVVLHMIQDMGVPAHANGLHHQGTLTEFDNFEALALQNWEPDFDRINRDDPGFADPSGYYVFSQEWTAADAPDYRDIGAFSTLWLTASSEEKALVRTRQGRTAMLTMWALRSAAQALAN